MVGICWDAVKIFVWCKACPISSASLMPSAQHAVVLGSGSSLCFAKTPGRLHPPVLKLPCCLQQLFAGGFPILYRLQKSAWKFVGNQGMAPACRVNNLSPPSPQLADAKGEMPQMLSVQEGYWGSGLPVMGDHVPSHPSSQTTQKKAWRA